ncbi:MAG TPA: putative glycoside hydrolase [Herpetosiphonaceae bacterium]
MRRRTIRPTYDMRRRTGADTSWFVFLIPLLLIAAIVVLLTKYPLSTDRQGGQAPGAAPQASETSSAEQPEPAVATSSAEQPQPTVTHPEVREWAPPIALQYFRGNDVTPEFMAENLSWLTMQYGMEDERQAVLERGYRGPLLQYMVTFQILGPGPYKNERDRCENDYTPVPDNPMWTDDFCELVHSHESWFLHNGKGERLYSKETNWDGTDAYQYYMNPASKGFRDFWVSQMKRQAGAKWQGFCLDNVPVEMDYLRTRADNQDGTVKEFDSSKAFRKAVIGLIDQIRESFPGYPIWGNMINAEYDDHEWDDYLPHLDGFQEENFATGWDTTSAPKPDEWDRMLRRVEKALARGKSVVLFGQGAQDNGDQLYFSLASFLLIATEDNRAAFRYTHIDDYKSLWWYPEYKTNLGLPKSKRYKQGHLWLRDFQCARVTVDPEARIGSIQLRPCEP